MNTIKITFFTFWGRFSMFSKHKKQVYTSRDFIQVIPESEVMKDGNQLQLIENLINSRGLCYMAI